MYRKLYLFQRMVQAKKYIDRHYQKEIDLNLLAEHACLSKYHLLRLFKTAYGTTPHQYLTNRRIEAAKLLLLQGNPATTVCGKIGYSSLSSFSHLFKRKVGLSPSEYYKKMLE